MKFNIGDRVIIEESNIECVSKYAGLEGTITSISSNPDSTHPYWITTNKNPCGVYCKVRCLVEDNNKGKNDKIVITHDGKTTTATLYRENSKPVKVKMSRNVFIYDPFKNQMIERENSIVFTNKAWNERN